MHCEHPTVTPEMNPWDSLREFYNTCAMHEFKPIKVA